MDTKNRFANLEDEGEEVFTPVAAAPAKEKKAAPKTNAAPRGGKDSSAPAVANDENAAPRHRDDRSDRPSGGKGKGKGKGSRPPKHDGFDRHSGAPRAGEKRENNGRGNWGKAQDNNTEEVEAEVAKELTAEEVEEQEKKRKEAEEEEKQMTLEEYKASKAGKSTAAAAARKANEGSTDKKQTVLYSKDEPEAEEFFFKGTKDSAKSAATKKTESKKAEKPVIETSFKGHQPERESRGGKGKGGKGERPQKNRAAPPPAADDNSAFPSLGS